MRSGRIQEIQHGRSGGPASSATSVLTRFALMNYAVANKSPTAASTSPRAAECPPARHRRKLTPFHFTSDYTSRFYAKFTFASLYTYSIVSPLNTHLFLCNKNVWSVYSRSEVTTLQRLVA